MIEKLSLENLSEAEKNTLKSALEEIIERTYDIEREYKLLQQNFSALQDLVRQLVESQPNPMWIIEKGNPNAIFYQNSISRKYEALIEHIDPDQTIQEIEYRNTIFLVKQRPVEGESGKQIITATDITEQKRSERLASMGQIAAHLAHEIRNPIGSIALMASTLYKRVDDKQKPLVEEIKSAISRVERIIKSTLLFTKGVGIHPSAFDLKRLATQIKEAFEHYAYTKSIDLRIDFPDTTIEGDFDLLTIVMQNFLFNSIDAIEESDEERGEIHFWYEADENAHHIVVTDTGVPIEDENILYEPFKTTKTKGHGLGLALSLEIMKAHNGTIALLHESKGFRLTLPRKSNTQKR